MTLPEQPTAETGRTLDARLDELEASVRREPARCVARARALVGDADGADAGAARARARRLLARALAFAGDLDEARRAAAEAVTIADEAGHAIESARARLASMHALGEMGRLDEAIREGEAAGAAFRAAGAPELAARADINLGIALLRGDAPELAVGHLDAAVAALPGDDPLRGAVENSRGEALVLLGRFAEARSAFVAARAAFARHERHQDVAIAEGNLADLAAQGGDLVTALAHFERAREALEASASPAHLARLLAERAEARATLGLRDAARADYEEALEALDRVGLALEAARARMGLAPLLVESGDRPAARRALERAVAAFAALGHRMHLARARLAMAMLDADEGRIDDATAGAHAALELLDGRPAAEASARALVARLELERGDPDAALAQAALGRAVATQLGLAPVLADLGLVIGRALRRRGDAAAAIAALSSAADEVERVRGTMHGERLRSAWLGGRRAIHEALLLAHLDVGAPDAAARALEVAERMKGRELLEQLDRLEASGETGPRDDERAPARARAERADAVRRLDAAYRRLGEATRAEAAAMGAALLAAERRVAEAEARLEAIGAGPRAHAVPADAAAIGASLAPDETLIEYVVTEGRLSALVVSARRIVAVRDLATSVELERLVHAARFQVERGLHLEPGDDRRAARALADAEHAFADLHDAVLAPLLPAIGAARRLVFVPHGALHLVPPAALRGPEGWLVERCAVVVAPSATARLRLPARRPDGAGRPLVVGVSDPDTPGLEAEARAVHAILHGAPDDLLLGAAATADAVRARAPHARIVHLACHGRFTPLHPWASGLRFADRWASLHELASLQLDAELVVLSGCETGMHAVEAGEELVGLGRSMLAGGAGAVVVGLWRVRDDRAVQILHDLHQSSASRLHNGDVAEAMRTAQRSALRRDPHPASWAPFTVIGR